MDGGGGMQGDTPANGDVSQAESASCCRWLIQRLRMVRHHPFMNTQPSTVRSRAGLQVLFKKKEEIGKK